MSNERGFVGELMHRRVPQYLGVYIAAVWLGIEIGDWLSDQFDLPARLTAYIFVFMAAMLPSVALFAWNHGAPGKDRSPPSERIFMGLNVLLAAAAFLVVPAQKVEMQPVAAAVVSEAEPAPVEARLGNSQRMLAFFWRNETAEQPDWYAYGVPFMLGEDMDRASPGFIVRTPFSSGSVMEALRQAGFERAISEPQSLQLKFANERQYNYFLRGAVADTEDGGLELRYTLHDAVTGAPQLSGSEPFDEATLLDAVDRISAALQAELLKSFDKPPAITDLPMAETMSESTLALSQYIEARIAEDIDRDESRKMALLNAAVETDPQFAEAHGLLGIGQYLQGQNDLALASFDRALDYDYKLSTESVFNLRINREMIANDVKEATEIARVWTQVEPDNESAFRALARLHQLGGLDLDVALAALKAVRDINPLATDTLQEAAGIERQRGNLEAAERYLQEFVAANPASVSAAISLAGLKAAKGDLDGALNGYQQAGYLDSKALEPELGMIGILTRKGDFARAEDRLVQLEQRELTDAQRLQLLNAQVSLYTLVGQYSQAIAAIEANEEVARRALPPLVYSLQFESSKATFAAFIADDPTPAIRALDDLRAQTQPPWTDFLFWFDLTAYSIHDEADAYAEALARAKLYFDSQSNANLDMMFSSAQAQADIYAGDKDSALANIEAALAGAQASILNVIASAEAFGIQTNMYDLMRRAGEPQRAIDGLANIVSLYPGLAIAHLRLAQAYFDVGNVNAARESLTVVLEIWRDADPELVFLKEANALQDALDRNA